MNKREVLNDIETKYLKGGKAVVALSLIIGLCIMCKLIYSEGVNIALVFAALPVIIFTAILIIKFYHRIFYLFFTSHFLLLLISSFIDIKLGAIILVFNLSLALIIVISSTYRKTSWKNSYNGMLLLYSIWALYCIIQLANPNTVLAAWNIAITHYFVYPILCALLVPITIRRYRNIEWLLLIWSFFIILAAIKGYIQKSHGFNEREMIFLFEKGGARTHIIWSGIRYFSFFTDAANYGVHMAMAMLGFGLSAYYIKNKGLKIYFSFIAILGLYGMLISGTRSAIAIPVGGLVAFTCISRNWKNIFMGLFALIVLFAFFRGTTIGNGNVYIYKMRSAFTPNKDASYLVRVNNKKLIKEYMAHKPFGYSLGLSTSGLDRFTPKEQMPIPPDSWLVSVWVETGIIGLILYSIIHIALFAWCSWILMFKIANKRLRNLLSVWLCVNAGFLIATYTNDVMQFPNSIIVFTGFALCFAGPFIEEKENII